MLSQMSTRKTHPDPAGIFVPATTGQALVFLRIKAGLTRDEAADLADISTGTLSRYENDQTARLDMGAIARYVDVLADANQIDADLIWQALRRTLRDFAATNAVLRSRTATKGKRRRLT